MSKKGETSSEVWATSTFATAKLPDHRLQGRLVKMAATLAEKPTDSIPQAAGNPGQAKAMYRFIENDRVTIETMRDAVADRAAQQCGEHAQVFLVQDTTSFSFPTAECMEDLGPVDTTGTRGMFLHSTLAVGTDGLAIGLLDQQYWCRDPEEKGKRYERYELPIEQKESSKWLMGIQAAREAICNNLPREKRPELVHIFDREGDIHEVLAMIVDSPDHAVIRCAHNRRIADEEVKHAHEAVRQSTLLGRVSLRVPCRKGTYTYRNASLELRAQKVVLNPRKDRYPHRKQIQITLVEAREINAPDGTKPLHWLLWTDLQVESLEDAQWVVNTYRKRWQIEEVHLVLKSGCKVEDLRFKTAERTAKMIAVYAPVAVRILQLRTYAHTEPEAPCTVVLTEEEWQVLYSAIHKKPVPKTARPPTVRQAVLWIGRLGGHLNRKCDGMPGVRALWRGWRDLQLMIPIYRAGRESR